MCPTSSPAFSVEAQGTGSFTGLSYTVPAHTSGTLEANIQTLAITSADVEKLRSLVMSMLEASKQEEIREYERTHASANLSIWSFWSAGASASYTKTRSEMESMGLTEQQITQIITEMFNIAKQMSNVKLNFTIRQHSQ